MNGTYVITYHTTPFNDRVFGQELRLDGRKSLKNLLNEAEELTRRLGHDSFKIYKMRGGDFTKPLYEFPIYEVL